MVVVNCTALPQSLAESELFGHERGAFTGATQSRMGQVRSADRGTLVLDQIEELDPKIQPKLLRVLQEREVTSVGGRAGQGLIGIRAIGPCCPTTSVGSWSGGDALVIR